MPEPKEYGSLTGAQLSNLMKMLGSLRSEVSEFESTVQRDVPPRVREALADGVTWADIYELSFPEVVAFALYAFGLVDWVKAVASAPDPQQEALESEPDFIWPGSPGGLISKSQAVGLIIALQRNILSAMLYGQSLCALIERARTESDLEALLKAVRVDRTVLSGPTASSRIARAELLGDRHFFVRLRGALKGPSARHMMNMSLKYCLFLLRDCGLRNLSDAQLEHLFVDVLKIYPKTPSARKNLRKQFYESSKLGPI